MLAVMPAVLVVAVERQEGCMEAELKATGYAEGLSGTNSGGWGLFLVAPSRDTTV